MMTMISILLFLITTAQVYVWLLVCIDIPCMITLYSLFLFFGRKDREQKRKLEGQAAIMAMRFLKHINNLGVIDEGYAPTLSYDAGEGLTIMWKVVGGDVFAEVVYDTYNPNLEIDLPLPAQTFYLAQLFAGALKERDLMCSGYAGLVSKYEFVETPDDSLLVQVREVETVEAERLSLASA